MGDAPGADSCATPGVAGERAVVQLPPTVVRERLAGLRRHTASHHAALEGHVDLIGRLDSVEHYIDVLARLYGLYAPFEAELGAAVARWCLPLDFEARRKVPLIARDLVALGIAPATIQALPRCPWAPRPTGPAAALGCLYVVEGATLGGQLIARHVERRLGIGVGTGAAFFAGYGAGVGPRWRTFCSVLADALRDRTAEREILTAASNTFIAFERWFMTEYAS